MKTGLVAITAKNGFITHALGSAKRICLKKMNNGSVLNAVRRPMVIISYKGGIVSSGDLIYWKMNEKFKGIILN